MANPKLKLPKDNAETQENLEKLRAFWRELAVGTMIENSVKADIHTTYSLNPEEIRDIAYAMLGDDVGLIMTV